MLLRCFSRISRIFWSIVRCVIHCATGPSFLQDFYSVSYRCIQVLLNLCLSIILLFLLLGKRLFSHYTWYLVDSLSFTEKASKSLVRIDKLLSCFAILITSWNIALAGSSRTMSIHIMAVRINTLVMRKMSLKACRWGGEEDW